MRLKIYVFIIFTLISSCSTLNTKQRNNNEAIRQVEEKLILLKDFLNGMPDSNLKIIEIINFFEHLTGIESESDGSDIGKFNPTTHDYEQWKAWFEINRGRLYLNNKTNTISIKK